MSTSSIARPGEQGEAPDPAAIETAEGVIGAIRNLIPFTPKRPPGHQPTESDGTWEAAPIVDLNEEGVD